MQWGPTDCGVSEYDPETLTIKGPGALDAVTP